MTIQNEKLWNDAAKAVISAGGIPIPVSNAVLELMQTLLNEKEAEFIPILKKPMNMDEIREKSMMNERELNSILDGLMHTGVVTGIPSKSTSIVVYRLMPPIPGLFEFTMMRGETTAREKKIAGLFEKIFEEITDVVQSNYEPVVEFFKTVKPLTRVVPIHRDVEYQVDEVFPYEDIKKIIDRFDTVAVANCYCRHEKNLLGKTCAVTKEKENCLFFGQTAAFVINYKFGRKISKEKAVEIVDKAREDGLVHKAFHVKQDLNNDEFAICNCCSCCCGTFQLYQQGGSPMWTYTSTVAKVKADDCTACGVCVDMCPMNAIEMTGDAASVRENMCIGCGVCAYHCAAEAIMMEKTGTRVAFVPPVKRK